MLARAPARYLVVSGACAALNNLMLIAGDAAGLHYAVCVLLTFLLVVPIGYLAHASWSFAAAPSWRGFIHYIAGSSSGLVIASAAVAIFRGGLALPMVITAPLATLLLALYNYWMTRWAVHRGKPRKPSLADL